MCSLDDWAKEVAKWAETKPEILQVYFVGSRVRTDKKPRPDSDLDVAITMSEPYGYTDWFFNADRWQQELQNNIKPIVHLLRGGGTLSKPNVEKAILGHGKKVFSRQ
ncbi:MAG: hypothetical protein ACSHW1_04150 [Yoonia sp.]|uniref:hypothetical protein n=1 Tax=Yoonia sp. TaxID=2212373 RepID=UPI003EF89711